MGWHCECSLLFMLVVSRGVCVVDGGGHLWAVVKFVCVGVVVGLVMVHVLWLGVICGQLWWWL